MGTSGSVEFMFEHKCNFMIANTGQDIEELEFELIDAGAEEVFEDEGGIMIYGDFPSFGNIQKALEENKFEILSSGFDRIPTTVKLTEEQEADVNKLLEKLKMTMMYKTYITICRNNTSDQHKISPLCRGFFLNMIC